MNKQGSWGGGMETPRLEEIVILKIKEPKSTIVQETRTGRVKEKKYFFSPNT